MAAGVADAAASVKNESKPNGKKRKLSLLEGDDDQERKLSSVRFARCNAHNTLKNAIQ